MAIIGIDLGTTNSLVSVYRNGHAELLPNEWGEFMTPSCVGVLEDGTVTVGAVAKERLITHPEETAASFKTWMGTQKEYILGGRRFLPQELSALVLRKLAQNAREALGEEIEEAIISVPAYFNDNQRCATRLAAQLAGLPVKRLINEPSAAALYYSQSRAQSECRLLVIDFGGGTLDVSVVDCFENMVEIVAIAGNNHLGGNDIDQATFKVAGCRAGFYHKWFNENVSVLVPEADIGAGLITYVLKIMTGKHVNFLEPFHIEDAYGTFAGGHAGPNDHNDPQWKDNVIIARDVRFAKTSWKYAGAPFAWYRISPGMKTIAQLLEENGKYKLVCFQAESLPGKHLLATYTHSIFRPVVPVKELFEKILRIGATQHFALVDGDWTKELEDFALIMNFEFYNIK